MSAEQSSGPSALSCLSLCLSVPIFLSFNQSFSQSSCLQSVSQSVFLSFFLSFHLAKKKKKKKKKIVEILQKSILGLRKVIKRLSYDRKVKWMRIYTLLRTAFLYLFLRTSLPRHTPAASSSSPALLAVCHNLRERMNSALKLRVM